MSKQFKVMKEPATRMPFVLVDERGDVLMGKGTRKRYGYTRRWKTREAAQKVADQLNSQQTA